MQLTLLFSRNQVLCLKNWKLWRAPYKTLIFFFLKFCTHFLLAKVYKRMFGIFFIFLRLELFAKTKKDLDSRSKQNEKNPKHFFVDIGKTETCAKFQQKISNTMVIGTRQFFKEITWFLGNRRALSKLKYWILHHLITIIKLQKNSP